MSTMQSILGKMSPEEAVQRVQKAGEILRREVHKVIVGQDEMIEQMLICLFARGHCLTIGVPGLAKTLTVSTLAKALHLKFNRIQFTPDLMPSDITGTEIIEEDAATGKRVFRFVQGPIFANIVLADEINRTPPKTQAALLQAMQEYQVTAGSNTFELEAPFFVMATQNPIEQEGTYPLPEAQLDRFLMKLVVGYPDREAELAMLDLPDVGGAAAEPAIEPLLGPEQVRALRTRAASVRVAPAVKAYAVDLVRATRDPAAYGLGLTPLIELGASPRGTLALVGTARAHALLEGRDYVTPHDVKSLARDVLRHRVLPSYEADAEGLSADDLLGRILDHIRVP